MVTWWIWGPSHYDLRCHNFKISKVVKFLPPCKMHILRCMGSKFCVKFQRAPLKFRTKFWTHTPQNVHFTVLYFCVWVTISLNCDVISLSETGPRPPMDPHNFHSMSIKPTIPCQCVYVSGKYYNIKCSCINTNHSNEIYWSSGIHDITRVMKISSLKIFWPMHNDQ